MMCKIHLYKQQKLRLIHTASDSLAKMRKIPNLRKPQKRFHVSKVSIFRRQRTVVQAALSANNLFLKINFKLSIAYGSPRYNSKPKDSRYWNMKAYRFRSAQLTPSAWKSFYWLYLDILFIRCKKNEGCFLFESCQAIALLKPLRGSFEILSL